jgi:hypothetical protein
VRRPEHPVRRVIIDECLGASASVIANVQTSLGLAQVSNCTFLAREHMGIPDSEI